MSERAAYESVLARVEKPGRYVGGEWNEIRKDPARVRTRVALAFPDVYEIGMSYLGQKILYALLNRDRDVLAERVFAPWPDFERELRAAGLPLASLENALPLGDFDIIGFSLLYELNYSNILTMLDLGGVPLTAAERGETDPLVIAGGPAAFNPEPVADLFDVVFVGDGEEGFPEIVRAAADLKRRGAPRRERLRELARIEGAYVPSLFRPEKPEGSDLVVPGPVPGSRPSSANVWSATSPTSRSRRRSWSRACGSSSTGWPSRPPAAAPRAAVSARPRRSISRTGRRTRTSSAGPPCAACGRPAMRTCPCRRCRSATTPGSRPRSAPGRPGPGEDLAVAVLAPSGTALARARGRHPQGPQDRLHAGAGGGHGAPAVRHQQEARRHGDPRRPTFAFEGGWQLVKLYFMVGLPTETDEDVAGIVDLVRDVLDLGRSVRGSAPRVHVSVSSFIPKPHTPFQWLGMEDEASLAAKQDFLRRELRRFRTVEVKTHPLATSVLEAVFSRGDRRLGRSSSTGLAPGGALRRLGRQARSQGVGGRPSPRPGSITAIICGRCRSRPSCPGTTSTPGSGRAGWPPSSRPRCGPSARPTVSSAPAANAGAARSGPGKRRRRPRPG